MKLISKLLPSSKKQCWQLLHLRDVHTCRDEALNLKLDKNNQTLVIDPTQRIRIINKKDSSLGALGSVSTLYEAFKYSVDNAGDRESFGHRIYNSHGPYKYFSYLDVDKRLKHVASGLELFGIKHGQKTKIAICGINRMEWFLAQYGSSLQGIVTVPLHTTMSTNALHNIVNIADVVAVVVDTVDRAKRKILPIINGSSIKQIFVMDTFDTSEIGDFPVPVHPFSSLETAGESNPLPLHPCTDKDLCLLVSTSGTTGIPKLVPVRHGPFTRTFVRSMLCWKSTKFNINEPSRFLSFLPLAHVYEQNNFISSSILSGSISFYSGDPNLLLSDIQEVKPNVLCTVPKLVNTIHQVFNRKVAEMSSFKRFLVKMVYNDSCPSFLKRRVTEQARQILGGRIDYITLGGAPSSYETKKFLSTILGVKHVLECYGASEYPYIASSFLDAKENSVGIPSPGTEIKLMDIPEMEYYSKNEQGEVCVRGEMTMVGYYKDATATREVLDEDGWYHTGDVGEWLQDGSLRIIDRKKNMFKLSNGRYIAPEKLENIYGNIPGIHQILIHGDSLRSSIVCLIFLNPAVHDPNLDWNSKEFKDILIEKMNILAYKNQLADYERVKLLRVMKGQMTPDNNVVPGYEVLTPTHKIQRFMINAVFKNEIDDLYDV